MEDGYDVVVCGCGSAGFCAAVAAAREGLSVAVAEKYLMPGGILTVLGNNSIDQFNNPFIQGNNMIITGIGWEFVRRVHKEGFADIPDMEAEYRIHSQYGVKVNPIAAAKVMDDMLLEAGVKLFYGQPLVEAEVSAPDARGRRRLESIVISTKSGLKKIKGKIFLDCTGDGDLGFLAGAEYEAGECGAVFQPGTLRVYPAVAGETADRILNFGDNENHVRINVTESEDIVRAEIEGRRMIFEQMRQGKQIMATAPAVAPREGRRIRGLSVIEEEDYCGGRIFEDSVCYSFWFVDIHRDQAPTYRRYITGGWTPTIRLSAMLSADLSNLMMAGRCISSDRGSNGALRVKASCMAMGQAAGTAAALALQRNTVPESLSAGEVREVLAQRGAIVPGLGRIPSFKEAMELEV